MPGQGIVVRVVKEIGGWASLRLLERYTHPTDETVNVVGTALTELKTVIGEA